MFLKDQIQGHVVDVVDLDICGVLVGQGTADIAGATFKREQVASENGMLLELLSQASMMVVPGAAPTCLLAGIARLATMECLKTVCVWESWEQNVARLAKPS